MSNPGDQASTVKVAYIMSRFPKLTETFVLYEILAAEKQGAQVELYPLMREHTSTMQAEAAPLVARAHYLPFVSVALLWSNLRALLAQPATVLSTLWQSLRATWGSLRYFSGILVFFPKAVHMARLMQQDDIQHIHAHFASHPAAVAFIIHRLTGIPYSFTAHGSDLHRDQHMLCEKVRESAFAVTISHYNKEVITRACGEQVANHVQIVHCGVGTDVFQPRALNDTKQTFDILCIGSLHEVKGQTYLIEACRILNERGIAFTCHFVGGGQDLAILQAQVAQAGLTDRVIFHGQVLRADVLALLQQADVVVAPSVPSRDGRREGIPVALMEAMASGIPVVASRLSGIPELVDDQKNGLLVAPGDAAGIAAALEQLYHAPQVRQQLGQAGRQTVLDAFDLDNNAARLVSLFGGTRA